MRYWLVILPLIWASSTFAQTSCICPKTKRDSTHILTLSENTTLETCGTICIDYWTFEIKEKIHVGYLFNNKTNESVFKWDKYATVKQIHDTVKVKEYFLLPIGENFTLCYNPFFITDIFYHDGTIDKKQHYVLDKNTYTRKEAKWIIRRYKARSTVKNMYSLDASENLRICYQLFWCYVSGNNDAIVHLKEAKKNLWLSIYEDEYYNLLRTYDEIEVYKQNGI